MMLALNKTKAALQGRLSHFTNFAENNITLIDQVNARRFAHIFFNYGKSPVVTAAMARFPTVLQICNSLLAGGMRRWRTPLSSKLSGENHSAERSADTYLAEEPADQSFNSSLAFWDLSLISLEASLSHFVLELVGFFPSESLVLSVQRLDTIHPNFLPSTPCNTLPVHIAEGTCRCICVGQTGRIYCKLHTLLCMASFYFPLMARYDSQPLASMPRACSSLRIIRLIHADTEASPSSASACLMPSSKPGSTRNAICLLPLPLISMVDIWLTPDYFELVFKCMTGAYQKATPRTVRAVPRRLTKPLIEVTVMAGSQHTQTHPEFTWRFLAVSESHPQARAIVVYTNAPNEAEARRQIKGCVLYFAARLPVHHFAVSAGVRHA